MVAFNCRRGIAIAWAALLLSLSACGNGATLQRMFSADPNAQQWSEGTQSQAQIPADFPAELQYPNAVLQEATGLKNPVAAEPTTSVEVTKRLTRWSTSDSAQQVREFYQQAFNQRDWQLLRQVTGDGKTVLTAQKQDLQVSVSFPLEADPSSNPVPQATATPTDTEFVVEYVRGSLPTANQASTEPTRSQPGDSNFIGPVATSATAVGTQAVNFSDLAQTPADLQPYVEDLAKFGVLTAKSSPTSGNSDPGNLFQPQQTIDRRTFARWLVETNNRIYRDRPARQIRLASSSSQSVFADVRPTDPDFPYIQGLAEAGYLPSSLTGDGSATSFRPDAPLTREALLQWKVPIDLQQILPTATVEGVRQVWGFKDANRIAPPALQAVLADHQNGDLANIRRMLGSTLLFQPQKPVTRAEAAAALWYIGQQGEGLSVKDVMQAQTTSASRDPIATDRQPSPFPN